MATQKTNNRQTSMSLVGFELTVFRKQAVLARAVNSTGEFTKVTNTIFFPRHIILCKNSTVVYKHRATQLQLGPTCDSNVPLQAYFS